MKYIPTEKLIAEIEMRIAQWQSYTFACASQIASEAFDRIDELKGLLIYIASLQQEQPEVDLEKEIDKEWAKCEPVDEGMGLESANIVNEQFDSIARYFYELGVNARKEETK